MRRYLTIIMLLGILLTGFPPAGALCPAVAEPVVRLTSGEWPPFTSRSLEGYGLFSQIVTQAFASEGVRVEYGFFPWRRSLALAGSGEWDGSVTWQVTEERQKQFYFSRPVVISQKVFFHRKGLGFDWNTLEDLKDWRIGTTIGYTYSPTFRTRARALGLTLIEHGSDAEALALMLKSRIDLHPNDLQVGRYLLRHYFEPGAADAIVHHPKPFYTSESRVLFSRKRPESKPLVETLNRGLEKLIRDGRYEKILSRPAALKPITVALAHWPPWKIIRDGSFSGVDVMVLQQLGREAGVTFEYIECPWKRCVEMIRSGEADMISSFSRTPDRERFAHYLTPPYRYEKVVFYKKKGAPHMVTEYKHLLPYTIGVIKGSKYFDPFDTDPDLKKIVVAREYQLLHMLAAGRIDLMAGHGHAAGYFIRKEGFGGAFEQVPFRVTLLPSYLALSKRSGAIGLASRLSHALKRLVETGRVDRIIQQVLTQTPSVSKH